MISERNRSPQFVDIALISAAFAVAMIATVIVVPDTVPVYRPDFVALVLIYLCVYRPGSVGIATAFVVGLLLDTLQFGVLGQHALAKILVACLILKLDRHMIGSKHLMQVLVVFVLLLLNSVVLGFINTLAHGYSGSVALWIAPFTGAVAWYLLIVFRRPYEGRSLDSVRH